MLSPVDQHLSDSRLTCERKRVKLRISIDFTARFSGISGIGRASRKRPPSTPRSGPTLRLGSGATRGGLFAAHTSRRQGREPAAPAELAPHRRISALSRRKSTRPTAGIRQPGAASLCVGKHGRSQCCEVCSSPPCDTISAPPPPQNAACMIALHPPFRAPQI